MFSSILSLLPLLLLSSQGIDAAPSPLIQDAVPTAKSGPAIIPIISGSGQANMTELPGFVNNGTIGSYDCAAAAAAAMGGGSQPVVLGPGEASSSASPTSSSSSASGSTLGSSTASASASASSSSSSSSSSSTTDAPNGTSSLASSTYFDYSTCPRALKPSFPYNPINLVAPDDSLRAAFIPYGAGVSEMWTKDRWGNWRDVVLGYDNTTNWGTDPLHPNFGPTVGRYANRIRNGTFTIDGTKYQIELNENNGADTLHGGKIGYDRSSFRIADVNSSSVTFELEDPDGNQGFPGSVLTRVTHTLQEGGVWKITMDSNVTGKRTPIMLSSHTYWNLEAYNETQTALSHTFHAPKADKYIATDSILVPTGELPSVEGTGFDFRTPKKFDELFNLTQGYCGAGCQGWDNCWINSEPPARNETMVELWSDASGIKVSFTTDQAAFQMYFCDGISSPTKGSIPRKRSHGGDGTLDKVYENHSCLAIEMQDYVDGINHPEWGRDQIYGPDRPYHWASEVRFSVLE